MECRASVGSAPDVGTQLRPDSGVSGYSMRTGEVILCDDAWSDSRVNTVIAQQMDARSIIIVPIFVEEKIVGLLEAFSRDTGHFRGSHVQQLQPFVDVLAEAIKEETASSTHYELDLGVPAVAGSIESDETWFGANKEETVSSTGSDLGPDATATASTIERDETEGRTETHLTPPPRFNRWRAIHLARGVVAGLLVLIVAIALFTYWFQNKSPETGNSAVNTQNAQSFDAGATEQGAVSIVKPEISFDPPMIDKKVGAMFGVNVVLKGAKNIWSAPMQILYDPEKLEVITVASGGLFNSDGGGATLVHRVDSLAGRIDVSISRPLSAPGISGDGIVFALVFVSKASGRSRLRVDQTGLRDTSARAVSVSTSEALVTITKSFVPAEKNNYGAAKARKSPMPPAAVSFGKTAPREHATRAEVDISTEAIPTSARTLPAATSTVAGKPTPS
jgi:hypothetical protein